MSINTQGRIVDIIQETHDTKTFTMRIGYALDYQAGQYVILKDDVSKDGKVQGVSRAYSIANAPHGALALAGNVQITVKIEPHGLFSGHLDRVAVGHEMNVRGPFGKFLYADQTDKPILLLGAGSGIVPLKCIIEHVIEAKLPVNVVLIDCNKTPADIIYKDLFDTYAKHDNIRIIHTLTRTDKADWTGRHGRIDAALIEKHCLDPDVYTYVCGPKEFVTAMMDILIGLGVPAEQALKEIY
ncbi:MAG: FAD-binding oxidoreductase [Nanoarchaeota archaeon]